MSRSTLRLMLWVLMGAAAALAGGCAGNRTRVAAEPGALSTLEAPSYAEVAAKHNERVARLDRLWSRAVFSVRYTDEDGRDRREQLEGHLQLVRPGKLALSGGKSITDTLFWLGGDGERMWWFELGDASRAYVAREANLGQPCCRQPDIPSHPRDVIDLLGVTPLPTDPRAGRTGWSTNGQWIVVEAPSQEGRLQLFLDPRTHEPGWVKLMDRSGRTLVFAELTDYENVDVRDGLSPYMPRVATRISIRRPDDTGEIRLSLGGMSDGRDRDGRLAPQAFDFDALRSALRPVEVVVLDRSCPNPALVESTETGSASPWASER